VNESKKQTAKNTARQRVQEEHCEPCNVEDQFSVATKRVLSVQCCEVQQGGRSSHHDWPGVVKYCSGHHSNPQKTAHTTRAVARLL